ncbi:MAG: S80 family phage morphogenetic serine protease [Anaeroplasmataceae bacterium]
MGNFKNQSIIDFKKPFLCSVEGYEPKPINEIIEVVDEKKRIVNTRLAECNGVSRNRCFYGLEETVKSLDHSKYIQENIAQGMWTGELEHPPRNSDLNRFMKIDDSRISHKIYKYWTEGDFLKGMVQFIPPQGDMVWRWITEADMNMAFSLRIYTPNYLKKKDSGGVEYVEKKYPMYPVTFDCVRTPGYENVRIADPKAFASQNTYYITNGKATNGTENYIIDWFDNDAEKHLKDLLNSTSQEDLNIVGDIFDMDMAKARAVLNPDTLQITMSAEDGRSVAMNINSFMFNNIMNKL